MSLVHDYAPENFDLRWNAYKIIDKEFHELLFKLSNILPQSEEFILKELDEILDKKILKLKGFE